MGTGYDAVVFDMDGVIFDSERACLTCWKILAQRRGLKNIEEVFLKCTGTTAALTKEIVLDFYGPDFPYDSFAREASLLFHERYDGGRLPIKSGTTELLTYLRKEKKKIALASSTRRETVERELSAANLLPFFDELICGDMIKRSKPAPDIYLKACELIHTAPRRSFAIEDSFNGIRSAHAAGLRPIMVPDLLAPTREISTLTETVQKNLLKVKEYLQAVG